MSSKKQTAVEWLADQIECFGNKHELQMSWTTLDELFEQAKEMEKEQITDAYWVSYKEGQYSGDKTADEYYNQTFKSE